MKNIIVIILLLNAAIVVGQTNSETYRFLEDIYLQIEKDTVEWKYQTGATELSFSGYYKDVLKVWDQNGIRKPKADEEDSLYFVNSQKISAKEYIIEQSKKARITIINEAHHISAHRTFTKSLLQDLYNNGYRYLGLEALSDIEINSRKYPVMESGYYTKEPEFGNLISEALKIGYTSFGYEASGGKNGKEREIEQAENIQKFIESNPDGKVLIHCGYAHAFENDYPAWGKAMAGRLKDNMKTDPFTIDQTMFLERDNKENIHLFIRLNNAKQPVVLIDKNGQAFNGKNEIKQTDVVILHPLTEFVNSRPEWLIKGKQKYTIPLSKIRNHNPVLILAYRSNEFDNNGVPADIIEIIDENSSRDVYLKKGIYTIVLKDRNYHEIDNYTVKIE